MELNLSGSKKWVVLLITSVSTFMATLDGSIVNIALPAISGALHVSISDIQWVVTSYLLVISALLLVLGRLSDLYGKKIIFSSGFIVFSLGSVLCAMSHTLLFLVIARVVQAVGAAAMMSLSQGIVTGVFAPSERGRALGFVGTMVAMGSLVGPSLGGILVHAFGWESIFIINVPIGLIGAVMSFTIIPEITEKAAEKVFDFRGTIFFILFILVFFLGLLLVQQGTLPAVSILPTVLISALLLFVLIRTERSSKGPLIDLSLFKLHEFSFGLSAAFLTFIAINSTMLFIPFYLEDLLHFSALKAGLIISVYPITMAVVAPISGWVSDKITYRPLTIVGMCIAAGSLFAFAGLLRATTPVPVILILLTVLGAGIAIFQSPNNSSIMGCVPRARLGIAGGTNALFRNLGMVSGTTFSVLIFSFATKLDINSLTGGFNRASFSRGLMFIFLFDGCCCVVSAALNVTRAIRIRPAAKQD